MSSVYLSMSDVIERYADVWSKWTIYEHVRHGLIPHTKRLGRRELLYRLDDLEWYEAGVMAQRRPRGSTRRCPRVARERLVV